MKGRSLNPSPSMMLYMDWKRKHFVYNLTAEARGKVKMSFERWCYNNGIDLSGKKLMYNKYLK